MVRMEQKKQRAAEARRQEKIKMEECKKLREVRHKEFVEARSMKLQQEEEERRSRLKKMEKEKEEREAQKAAEREKVNFYYLFIHMYVCMYTQHTYMRPYIPRTLRTDRKRLLENVAECTYTHTHTHIHTQCEQVKMGLWKTHIHT
jgi:hypothetical protein